MSAIAAETEHEQKLGIQAGRSHLGGSEASDRGGKIVAEHIGIQP